MSKGKVIDIREWRARKQYYPSDDSREWIMSDDDVERLSKEGKYTGTYTPLQPYGPERRDDEDG